MSSKNKKNKGNIDSNLQRLSNSSYYKALRDLKESLENAREKESMSVVRLKHSTDNYVKVRSIRNKVEEGNHLTNNEALEVGLLRIS